MKKITKEMLKTMERQMFNKGRDIDVALFNTLMDPEAKPFVLDCLYFYLNKDGGIGNGLEIDNYNTNSSVYQTYEALRILEVAGFDSKCEEELFQMLVQKMCNYLFNRCEIVEGKWNPVVKTNNDFAHSAEYHYDEQSLIKWQFHPTAAILGYLLLLVPETKACYKKALKQLQFAFDYFENKSSLSEYDFISFNALLGVLKKKGLFEEQSKKIEEKLLDFAVLKIGDSQFEFAKKLSNCTLTPALEEEVAINLDSIIDTIAPHGLWEHKKGWGINNYPEEDSAMLKWIGAETVTNLALLQHYNRIEK